jgi:hypothetical protein
MWEYRLFAAALTDCVQRHRSLARRHRLKLAFGTGEDIQEPMKWIQGRFEEGLRLAATLTTVFTGVLQQGLGPPGQHGDAETIAFAAEAVGDLYRDAMLWSSRVRTANVDKRFRRLLLIVGDMLNQIIDAIEAYGPRVKRDIEDALAAPDTGEERVIRMRLTIAIDKNVETAYFEEIERLKRELGAHAVYE